MTGEAIFPDETDERPAVHPAVAEVFRALGESGTPWMLLRGEDDLLHPEGDVDILVDGACLTSLDELMAGVGFRRVTAAGHGSHRFYFAYASGGWVKLDIVSEISFGPYQQWRTDLAPRCLARRLRYGRLWLPDIADQAWLQLLHLFLDKGTVAPQRRAAATLAAAIASYDDELAAFADERMGGGTAATLLGLVRGEDWADVPVFAAWMRRASTAHTPIRARLVGTTNRLLRRTGARIKDGGMLVGVMAPDGAGKTTLLTRLVATVPLPTRYVYMGLWGSGPWDSVLTRIPGGRLGKKVFRIFRGGLAARYHRALGRVVFLDRVAYDTLLLPGPDSAGAAEKLSNALALRVAPEPDVLLVLDVPGETMFARKGEHSADVLEGWRKAYLQIAGRLPMAHVVDADQSQERVGDLATDILWRNTSPPRARPDIRVPTVDRPLPLHLWRRLDWRFLLPDLQPRSVGYGGKVGEDMVAALHLLDPCATPLGPGPVAAGRGAAHEAGFDVVLLSEPDRALCDAAAGSVRPGGWICVTARRAPLARRSGPRTLAGWKRKLARDGFEDVSVYWHAPSLESAARMVPASSARAIKDTLALHRDVRFGLVKAAAARLALALHVFEAAIPEGTVTGRRPAGEARHELH